MEVQMNFIFQVNCFKKKCPPNHFECPDGQCYPLIWKCDFDADCSDRSDENDCHYQNQTCKPDEFKLVKIDIGH